MSAFGLNLSNEIIFSKNAVCEIKKSSEKFSWTNRMSMNTNFLQAILAKVMTKNLQIVLYKSELFSPVMGLSQFLGPNNIFLWHLRLSRALQVRKESSRSLVKVSARFRSFTLTFGPPLGSNL